MAQVYINWTLQLSYTDRVLVMWVNVRGEMCGVRMCFLVSPVSDIVLDIANETAKVCFLSFQSLQINRESLLVITPIINELMK